MTDAVIERDAKWAIRRYQPGKVKTAKGVVNLPPQPKFLLGPGNQPKRNVASVAIVPLDDAGDVEGGGSTPSVRAQGGSNRAGGVLMNVAAVTAPMLPSSGTLAAPGSPAVQTNPASSTLPSQAVTASPVTVEALAVGEGGPGLVQPGVGGPAALDGGTKQVTASRSSRVGGSVRGVGVGLATNRSRLTGKGSTGSGSARGSKTVMTDPDAAPEPIVPRETVIASAFDVCSRRDTSILTRQHLAAPGPRRGQPRESTEGGRGAGYAEEVELSDMMDL